jgi:ABC-type multidrug transport system fused ATPase/permease subunit
LVSLALGSLALRLFGTTPNPLVAGLADVSVSAVVLTFLKTIPQLFGEEVLTILPFLAVLFVFYARMGFSRKSSIVWAWLISAAFFSAAGSGLQHGLVGRLTVITVAVIANRGREQLPAKIRRTGSPEAGSLSGG